jgi:hypothetical protein
VAIWKRLSDRKEFLPVLWAAAPLTAGLEETNFPELGNTCQYFSQLFKELSPAS